MKNVIAVVLAGGMGRRLRELTAKEAKPALMFGGKYRIIDFSLNNLVNSEISVIKVLVQAHSQKLVEHISGFWVSDPLRGNFIDIVPPQMKTGGEWYQGTADAVFQNLDIICDGDKFSDVAIFSGDHVFNMDARQMYYFHNKVNSDFTISSIPMPITEDLSQFGIIKVENDGRICGFIEKSKDRYPEIPWLPGYAFISMGIYLAKTDKLIKALIDDSEDERSGHDFGKDVIPLMLERGYRMYAYDFRTNEIKGVKNVYWRDVGTIKSYFDTNIELTGRTSNLDLDNKNWPLRTFSDYTPPAKITGGGQLDNALLSGGCLIDGGMVKKSVLSYRVKVMAGATLERSVVFPNVEIGRGAKVRNAILHNKVKIPPGIEIGFSEVVDKGRGFYVEDGITVVTAKH